jgi:hypothetical protein
MLLVEHAVPGSSHMSSQPPPKKKYKTSVKNPASNITSFRDLGLSFQEPNDNVIIRHDASGSSGQHRQTTTTAPHFRDRLYTAVDHEGDWEGFQDQDQGDGSTGVDSSDKFVFQVKKGRVSKLQKRKLVSSVRTF